MRKLPQDIFRLVQVLKNVQHDDDVVGSRTGNRTLSQRVLN